MRSLIPFIMATALPVAAQDMPVQVVCNGVDPQWDLRVYGQDAQLSYRGQSDLSIALETPAEGAQWPRALTLIGRGDSAIAILTPGACSYNSDSTQPDFAVQVLTQRAETPVLLLGCCQSATR